MGQARSVRIDPGDRQRFNLRSAQAKRGKNRSCQSDQLLMIVIRPIQSFQVWRFLTYMFVHRDIFHLLYNVIGQLTVGVPLELVHGSYVRLCGLKLSTWNCLVQNNLFMFIYLPISSYRVMSIFLVSVLSGSLYSAISDPQAYIAGMRFLGANSFGCKRKGEKIISHQNGKFQED